MSVVAKGQGIDRVVPGTAIPTLACAVMSFIVPFTLTVDPIRSHVLLAFISSVGLCFGILALARRSRAFGRELAFALLGTVMNGLMLCGALLMLLVSLNQKMLDQPVDKNGAGSAATRLFE